MTATAPVGRPQVLDPRLASVAALVVIVLSGLAGGTLLALPRPQPAVAPVPTAANFAGPTPRQFAIAAIGETIAAAEAYYADHRTYDGIKQSDLLDTSAEGGIPNAVINRWLHKQTLFRYGGAFYFVLSGGPYSGPLPLMAGSEGHIYFASEQRYCVEYGQGTFAWSKNGPLAPLQRGLCRRPTLRRAPAPHDGVAPDLPLDAPSGTCSFHPSGRLAFRGSRDSSRGGGDWP